MTDTLRHTDFSDLKLLQRGKVRDVYDLGDSLLMVATDRLSAFDVVLPDSIPDKGRVLTQISIFWFDRMRPLVANHVISADVSEYPAACRPYADSLAGRSMRVRKTRPLPIECVVRGYLSGSGWTAYRRSGAGLRHSSAGRAGGIREAARTDLHPLDQGRTGTARREHRFRRRRRPGRPRAGGPGPRPEPGHLSTGGRSGRRPRHYHRRHQIRIRPGRWRVDPHRRGAHAGQFAFLAQGRLPPGRPPAEFRQAVRPRLPAGDSTGTNARRDRPCRKRSSPARGTSI